MPLLRQRTQPAPEATVVVDSSILATFTWMANSITELHKLLLVERTKNEKLFEENMDLKMKIKALRFIEHCANPKGFVSETVIDNSSTLKDECTGNKEELYPVEQKQPIQQLQSSQAKKKRKNKTSVSKPAQSNFADEEIAHSSANQVPSLSDINIRNNKHGNDGEICTE